MGVLRLINGVIRNSNEDFTSISLTASSTLVASAFTFAHATYSSQIIKYSIKEATSNNIRGGTITVVTNGTNVSLIDTYTETANAGVVWSAAINGSNVELTYVSTANTKTMKYSSTLIPT
jgi:hypothetical protein